MRPFDYAAPSSVDGAIQELAKSPKSRLVGGGTDLLREIRGETAAPDLLISLRDVPALNEIRAGFEGGLKIGARATLADIANHPVIRSRYSALAEAAAGAATPQIRNVATLAGNVLQRPSCEYYRGRFECVLQGGRGCAARDGDNTHHAIFGNSPCVSGHPSDVAAALLAHNARVTWRTPGGETTAAVATLHRPPDWGHPSEIALDPRSVITAFHLPPFTGVSAYLQARERRAWAFALVGVAARLAFRDGRIAEAGMALCGVAPVPWRLSEVEDFLTHSRPNDPGWIQEAGRIAIREARPLSGNAYKVGLVQGLVERALRRLSGQ